LVLEAARMLYVSITRAEACCVVSFSGRRIVHGKMSVQAQSRFAPQLGGAFVYRGNGMTDDEVEQIMADCGNL
jgi:superfamily I DNA/RNA helicase